ncbi:uncharacterized protein LOC141672984 [Apium graveolens]|uniref:uncharacterized protein LOC141672984 n=1 Tax=Apium graveolens TaxID=4045 RepID=UPI003D7B804C
MASTQNYDYNFPYFPPYNPHSPPKIAPPSKPNTKPPPPKFPAPPPHHPSMPPTPAAKPPKHSTPPPSPTVKPPPRPNHPPPPSPSVKPPPSPIHPPPPSHPNYPPPSHPSYPPPPSHPIHPPPPPHIVPTPPPPGHHSHTVIVVIFVSLGGIFFLAFLSVALFCFLKKKKKTVQETDIVKIDEHLTIKEAIIPGPHGPQTVILSVEDDIHIQEDIRKNESSVGHGGSHMSSVPHHPHVLDMEPSTSGSSPHHHLGQKTT